MCILRSLFTCQRDIGTNTEKPDLTYIFRALTGKGEENTYNKIKSTFCNFLNSVSAKGPSLYHSIFFQSVESLTRSPGRAAGEVNCHAC